MTATRLRKVDNWIEDFVSKTSFSNSPEIYRRWSAIYTIGTALQRKCCLLIQGEPLFTNFYIVLVGPPGVGKTRAIRFAKGFLSSLKDMKISPNALSKEKMIDNLAAAVKIQLDPKGQQFTQTAYACILDELSTFIQYRDYSFMTHLTDMFDSPKIWEYETLSRGSQRVENLFLSILGGITPKSIQNNWGEAAIGMGFTARLNFVYSEDYKPLELFAQTTEPNFKELKHDLERIYNLHGTFGVTPEAAKFLQEWVSSGMHPMPADTRFAEYNPRRSIHWLKLCMVYSAAESDDLVITLSHAQKAQEVLLEAEKYLPLAFEHLGQNPLLTALNSLHSWLKAEFLATQQGIIEQRVRRRLLADVPPQYVDAALQELVNSGLCKVAPTQAGKIYVPNLTRMGLD